MGVSFREESWSILEHTYSVKTIKTYITNHVGRQIGITPYAAKLGIMDVLLRHVSEIDRHICLSNRSIQSNKGTLELWPLGVMPLEM